MGRTAATPEIKVRRQGLPWTRVVGVVAVVTPFVIATSYRLGAYSKTAGAAEPTDHAPLDQSRPEAPLVREEPDAPVNDPPLPASVDEPVTAESDIVEPMPPEPTAEEHRDQTVDEIRASGEAPRGLFGAAQRVSKGWSVKIMELGAHAEFGPLECHAKGCFMNVLHNTSGDVDRAMDVITRTGEFHAWRSGKMRSGPITKPDGKVETTWFLFPPSAGTEALAAALPEDTLDELRPSPGGTQRDSSRRTTSTETEGSGP